MTLATRGRIQPAVVPTPNRRSNTQSHDTSPLTIQLAIVAAERDTSENGRLEALQENSRLIQENLELRQTLEDLNRRLDEIPEIVKAAVETFLSAETE